jgi:filamentous hemagglutinin family protein
LRASIAVTLLGSVSALALLSGFSPARALSLKDVANSTPVALAVAAQQAAAAQAAAAARQAQDSLARAAAALQAARDAQAAARAIARQVPTNIPDGIAKGGLMPDPGIAIDPTLWRGADQPTQSVKDGQTAVDIKQFLPKAILTWETFNVGRNTTLNFKQDAADWTVFNRVNDPSASPSFIRGQINALGGVYIINRNGIVFDGNSQINLHALVASTLDVGKLGMDRVARDQYFLNTGIANPYSFSIFDESGGAATNVVGGNIQVERGASITTTIVSPDSPGFVYLFGANVSNSGNIIVPAGQAGLVAARAIELVPYGYSLFPNSVLPADVKFRGTEFRIQRFAYSYQPDGTPLATCADGSSGCSFYLPFTGKVIHDGLVETPRGIVVMNGDQIEISNSGVISADTSISRNSMVLLRAATSVAVNGTISILPSDDGNTLPLLSGASTDSTASSVQSFMPAFVEMTAQRSVTLGSAGLISAPSASVSLRAVDLGTNTATGVYPKKGSNVINGGFFLDDQTIQPSLAGPQRVLLQPGATIDVAGLQDVVLSADYNFIAVQPRAEFADMPLQRNGALYGETLWVDIRASGTRSDGTKWVGTPLFDASGVIGKVGRSIQQLMTAGGTVSLTTDIRATDGATPNRDVVTQEGSIINAAGGSVRFLPGAVSATRLVGIDGRIYSMENADPNIIYVGLAGQFTIDHPRWGLTEVRSVANSVDVPGYVEGHDAGGLTVSAVSPVLQGSLLFGSVVGERQAAFGLAPSVTGGVTKTQAKGDELPSQGYLTLTTPSTVVIGANGQALPDAFNVGTLLPPPNPNKLASNDLPNNGSVPSNNFISTSEYRTTLSADRLSAYGLSLLDITANDFVLASGNMLTLAAGGSLSVKTGSALDIAGLVVAAGGNISLQTNGSGDGPVLKALGSVFSRGSVTASGHADVFVGGTLDVSGRWINDDGHFGADALGPGFINGGSISITTNKSSTSLGGRDTTGNILLAMGSLLDASSGGYISPRGTPKLGSSGTLAGKGGGISLVLYQGTDWSDGTGGGPPRPGQSSSVAELQLDGNLRAYGFESNGSLRLGAADTIKIGGALAPGEKSAIRIGGHLGPLPLSLFAGGMFGAYTIETVQDGWSGAPAALVVSAGVNLALQQRNLSSTTDYRSIGSGTKIAMNAPLALLPGDQRKAIDLTFKSTNILLDEGARIETDPLATIAFAGSPIISVDSQGRENQQDKPAENMVLRGSIINHGGAVSINARKTWLGPQALVDLSGTFVANSRFGLLRGPAVSGTLLAGGSFSIEAAEPDSSTAPNQNLSGTYVVSEQGAVVNISGATATLRVRDTEAPGFSAVDVAAWSDAGKLSVDAGAFIWGGKFTADIDSRANGGTLVLGGSTTVVLAQNSDTIRASLDQVTTPSTPFGYGALSGGPLGQFANQIRATADSLAPFENIFLYAGTSAGGAARIFTDLPGNSYGVRAPTLGQILIDGAFTWNVANRLHLAANVITSLTPGSSVTLAAPYMLLTSAGAGGAATGGSSTLTVRGQTIDIEGAVFSGFGQVNFFSSNDIRLSTPKVANGLLSAGSTLPADTATFTGRLAVGGNLTMEAQRIFPVSAVDFTIETSAADGVVTFQAPAGSNTSIPLSAGGSLTVSAPVITQNGNLFAPLGQIALGRVDITQQVTLGAGSLTSVTLADTVVPYGETQDGTNWYYNAGLKPLDQPPSKGLILAGANVTFGAGSRIDTRGGGDLQAMEFIQGKGGSRDVLATQKGGATVYALLPSVNDPVAAFDVHFTAAHSADKSTDTQLHGDDYPLAGKQIYIDGGNGIPAGTYTLYPAHYATLPGALRVVEYGSNLGRNIASGTTLPGGTMLVSGHYTQSIAPQKQSSGETLFAIQTGPVWQQYSEFSFSGANRYFVDKATHDGVNVPRLPIDAGRLAVAAQQSIILQGIALTQPGAGGRGGELDISGLKLAVVGHDQYVNVDVPAGYVSLDVTQLNNWGFESILVGGLRSDTAKGTLITPTAANVLVDTRGDAFSAPEILLAAQAVGEWRELDQWLNVGVDWVRVVLPTYVPVDGSGSVTIRSGSIIETTGLVHTGYGRNYYVAEPNIELTPAFQVAAALGGLLDPSGTLITGVDLRKLPSFWYWNNFSSSAQNRAGDITSLGFYSYGGATTQQPGLGALFVATNDTKLVVSGPTGVPVQPLTVQFADVSPGALPGVPVSGHVTGTVTLPAGDAGSVSIESGVKIVTEALTLQATKQTDSIKLNANAEISAKQVNVTARTIGIEATPSQGRTDSAMLSAGNLAQFAGVQGLSLKAMAGGISFYGDVNFDPGSTMSRLVLDAGAIVGTGGNTAIKIGGTVSILNTGATFSGASAGANGTLSIDAAKIDFGGGVQTIAGFRQVEWNASERVFFGSSGALTLGAGADQVDLNVASPNILVGGNTASGTGSFALNTQGVVTFTRPDGAAVEPAASDEIGGNLAITASSINLGSTIQAQAGTLTLRATTGNVSLQDGAFVAAGGYKKTLVDADTYVAGGKVVLQADAGDVVTASTSVIDVSQPAGGIGYGGQIEVSALRGRADLNGALRGSGGSGLGGSLKIDTRSLVSNFDLLADRLLAGGITGAIDIHTRDGNLTLSQGHTLKANVVTLTADDTTWDPNDPSRQLGQIIIGGTIDARGYSGATADGTGQAGGKVGLYGVNAVTLASTGVINASTTHTDERGGDVVLGISWGAAGAIDLQPGSRIDVSGGTKGGLRGGTVTLRAPRDGADDVKVVQVASSITGARDVTIEGFVTFNTQGSANGKNGIDGSSLGWDGIIDPAGWYKSDMTLVTNGSWTNVTGVRVNITNGGSFFSSVPTVTISAPAGGTAARGVAVMGLDSSALGPFNVANPGLPPNQTNIPITFPTPPGGVAAQGTAATNASGQLVVTITNPGSGYTSVPTSVIVGGLAANVTSGRLKVVSVAITNIGSGYTAAPSISFSGGGGFGVQASFVTASNFTGKMIDNQFVPDTNDYIPLISSGVFNQTARDAGTALFTGDSLHSRFFTDTLVKVTQGTWADNGKSYGFGNTYAKLNSLVQELGPDVVHVRPGVELVNSGSGSNSGNITIATNLNLAAGGAYNLQSGKYVHVDETADPTKQSYVAFDYRLVTPWGNIEPGALALRSAGDISVKASISDGFFQFRDYLDPTYRTQLTSYFAAAQLRGMDGATSQSRLQRTYLYYLNSLGTVPVAPYPVSTANSVSPRAANLSAADLFPNVLNVCVAACGTANARIVSVADPSSWSYRLTAGADLGSANVSARTNAQKDVVVSGHANITVPTVGVDAEGRPISALSTLTVAVPTMIRTGTGDIGIAAARDVIMSDTDAPGVIYAAGVNTAKLPGPQYTQQTVGGVTTVVALNPDGFLEPQIVAYNDLLRSDRSTPGVYGLPTAAAFPHKGGDVEVVAQRDIVGYSVSTSGNRTNYQYYEPWLMADAELSPATQAGASSVSAKGAGVFAPFGTNIASQTAWWIQYSSFQQGILSAGGNVSVIAGRDLRDVSVSLPATGRVSGGLSASNTPVTHIYDSGNMTVRAGRDILGGSFYEGSGHASIVARGSLGQIGTLTKTASSTNFLPNVPLFAVDTGQIHAQAGGSLTTAGVINPAALHLQHGSFANTAATSATGDQIAIYMDTYGPDSAVSLMAITGDLTIRIAPTAISDTGAPSTSSLVYPASFEAVALNGSIQTTGLTSTTGISFGPVTGMILSPSEHGNFNLLAEQNIDLTFGYLNESVGVPRPYISAGPALLDKAFDPFRPNAWAGTHSDDPSFAGAFSAPVLAHSDDDAVARIYAANGDILGVGTTNLDTKGNVTGFTRVEINRPTKVYAGRDIVDLNLIAQNIHADDVSSVAAGRDIRYTGWNNGGGLQIAGPGFFSVEAGRDLGPFLPATHDTASEVKVQQGVASVGNTSMIPVGNTFLEPNIRGGLTGMYNSALFGPFQVATKRRNALLGGVGADISLMFGVKFGADYDAVIRTYIDPANAADVDHNYLDELVAFLRRVGNASADKNNAWTLFQGLPQDLQKIFVGQVFFAELRAVGQAQQGDSAGRYRRGYTMVNTLFPASRGYTANSLGGGTNGANELVRTGDLDMLHATVQTRQGGDISIFGPGGTIRVGSLATEPNNNLKLRDLGILTLGGGAINTFTDESVRVNSSRVFTTQGGDILMWSSNGDLDAGRGAQTTLSLPPLQVVFDQDDYQTVDLGGFVTGAGIGVLKASDAAVSSNLYLLAPRGTVDAGSAGIRASGNLVVAAVQVVNGANVQVGGTSTGVSVISFPNVGALTTASSAAGAASKAVETPTGSVGNTDQASIFIVEVTSYGGGDQLPSGTPQPGRNDNKKPEEENATP